MNNSLRRFAVMLPLGLAIVGCANDFPLPATSSVTLGASPYSRGELGRHLPSSGPHVAAIRCHTDHTVDCGFHFGRAKPGPQFRVGNILSDIKFRTRLVQDGHTAQEVRLRTAIGFYHGEGEFLLSRNRHALMTPPSAAGIVTGTYAVGSDSIYVSLKLVSATDARIIAGADFVVSLRDVWGMLPPNT